MIEFAALFVFVLILGAFLLGTRRTILGALAFIGLSVAVAAGLAEMQSRAKPINLEWRSVKTANVLWYELREGASIQLLLGLPSGPRFYVMPWDGQAAEQLIQGSRKAALTGGMVKMNRPFERSLDENEPVFHASPQPVLPPKE